MPEMRRIAGERICLAMGNLTLGAHLSDALRVARISMGAGLGSYPAATVYWPPYLSARRRVHELFREAVVRHRATGSRAASIAGPACGCRSASAREPASAPGSSRSW